MSPASAYADAPFTLNVFGMFRGAYTIDTGSGTGAVDARAFRVLLHPAAGPDGPAADADVAALSTAWIGDGILAASMPAGIGKGLYDVYVRDPRGQTLSLPSGFRSLGSDSQVPMLEFTYPPLGTLLGSETSPLFGFRADDTPGFIREMHWRASTDAGDVDAQACPVPADTEANICLFTVTLPRAQSMQDFLYLELSAADGAQPLPHTPMMQVTFPLVPKPIVTGGCSVTAGSTKGGTQVTVTGSNFVQVVAGEPASGTQIILKDNDREIPLDQEDPTNEGEISFTTPSHEMGPVTILLRNGLAQATACTFNYLPGPIISHVSPPSGSRNGGTVVTITGTNFPNDVSVMLQGDVKVSTLCIVYRSLDGTEIHGVMPPGTGSVAFVADGGAAGLSPLVKDAFAYDVDAPFDPSAWPVPGCDPGSGP